MRHAQTLRGGILTCGLLATALAVTPIRASAQDVTVRGSGTCQGYLDAKRSSVEKALKDLRWLLEYVSGLAVATHVNILANDDNADAMLTWVNTYCEVYPAKYLSDAGDLFYRFRLEQMKACYPK